MDYHVSTIWLVIISLVVIWDLVWRSMALWHAARQGEKIWFGILLVINSAGILPIVYLAFNRSKER